MLVKRLKNEGMYPTIMDRLSLCSQKPKMVLVKVTYTGVNPTNITVIFQHCKYSNK
jgi:hypothetical protein